MQRTNSNVQITKEIDAKFHDSQTKYGAYKIVNKWHVVLWHPWAQQVQLIIFDRSNHDQEIRRIAGQFQTPNWFWEIEEEVDGYFYQYEITQADNQINRALDPYAKSMAAFNWEGKHTKVGKAAFVNIKKVDNFYKLGKINAPQPIIYEAHVRDMTSLRKDVNHPGSFNALIEINAGKHLKELGVTHLQLLPIHSCYALDETTQKILNKGAGQGWKTNYNWGYDPHNYFTINGWYSSKPHDPYARIHEFKNLVAYFHKKGIKVILDVVYNHLFHNDILNNVVPNYYFRQKSTVMPVDQVALASERKMTRRIIIDSLKHFVEAFDVDGFRFDFSTFLDKETLLIAASTLRKIKPNLILHGEAWDFSDLPPGAAFNKMHVDNNIDFAYFNDTTRNAIKGEDDEKGFEGGLISGDFSKFPQYLSSIVANNPNHQFNCQEISTTRYDLFTKSPNVPLNYVCCHDGHTLWDKINLLVTGSIIFKFEKYRQALMMNWFLPGRILFLQGTEMLYSKPIDKSGYDYQRSHQSKKSIDMWKIGTSYAENSYKTTDYVNGLRWNQLANRDVKKFIFDFLASLNKFRVVTKFFNYDNIDDINHKYQFNYVSRKRGIIDFSIKDGQHAIRIIHNLMAHDYVYTTQGTILFHSKIINNKATNALAGHSSILIKEET